MVKLLRVLSCVATLIILDENRRCRKPLALHQIIANRTIFNPNTGIPIVGSVADQGQIAAKCCMTPGKLKTQYLPSQMSTSTTAHRTIRAPHGTDLTCKNWVTEAAYRMIQNNLDPDVAERPEDLVVYGGNGKAARNEI